MSKLASGPDARAWEDARKLLVEGRPVAVGTTIVRFYPSYREVARRLETNVSRVARWAQREGILDLRRKLLSADRASSRATLPKATETLFEETLRLVNASWATSRLRLSQRKLVTVLKIVALLSGRSEAPLGIVAEVERLRTSLLKARMS